MRRALWASAVFNLAGAHHAARGRFGKEPAHEHDREEARYAQRSEGDERPVDAGLASEPGICAAEEGDHDSQGGGVHARCRTG